MCVSVRYDSLQEAVDMIEEIENIENVRTKLFDYIAVEKEESDDEDYLRTYSRCLIM